jgi:hypothetical protein
MHPQFFRMIATTDEPPLQLKTWGQSAASRLKKLETREENRHFGIVISRSLLNCHH